MIVTLLAAGAGAPVPPQGSFLDILPMMLLLIVVFYFLMIRPQQKKQKEHKTMVEALKRGDTIVSIGGIVGKVSRVKDDEEEIEIEIAEGVKMRLLRSAVQTVRVKGEPVKVDKS